MPTVIPVYGSVAECPKCGAPSLEMVSTVYHAEVQLGVQDRPPCVRLFMTEDPEREDEDFDLEAELENHLCRDCRRCGHGWVERALDHELTIIQETT